MKIRLSPRADRDFSEAVAYLIDESPAAARLFADTIELAFENLRSNPEMGSKTQHPELRAYTLTTFRYRIIYRIIDQTISIETIFHTAQNPDKI